MSAREPERLRRGKRFHRQVQEDWARTAEGTVTREHQVLRTSGRRGRIDVYVDAEGDVAVVEIKASDWDAMTERNVRRNVRRQIRQIWSYIETQLEELDKGRYISPGVIFRKRPTSPVRLQLIEEMFLEEGIAVAWEDETIEERRTRADEKPDSP